MLESYKTKQSSFYNFIKKVSLNNKIAHAYMIETNGAFYGFDLALSMAKYFLCPHNFTSINDKCSNCTICEEINNNCFLDLSIIDNELTDIKKEQILELQEVFSTKAVYGKYRIYIIKNVNMLNKSSANTLLKFLEEPQENVIAILLTTNVNNVISTIVSRCQVISLTEEKNVLGLFAPYCDIDNLNDFYNENINIIINFYSNLEELGSKMLIYKNDYIDTSMISLYLKVGGYFYYDILRLMFNQDVNFIDGFSVEKNKIMKNVNIDDIINKIDILNQFILNECYNVNKDLFLDNFIITFTGGVRND